MKSGPRFGLPSLTPPPVDFRALSDRIRSVVAEIQRHDSVERFCRLGAKVEFGSPVFAANDRGLAEGEGCIKLLLDKREKPLGVQILGPRAGDILSEWVAVMNGGTGLSKIASAIHPYPTLSEINKKVVGSVFTPKIFSDTVRKGLKFFFSFKGRACTCGRDMDCE